MWCSAVQSTFKFGKWMESLEVYKRQVKTYKNYIVKLVPRVLEEDFLYNQITILLFPNRTCGTNSKNKLISFKVMKFLIFNVNVHEMFISKSYSPSLITHPLY